MMELKIFIFALFDIVSEALDFAIIFNMGVY